MENQHESLNEWQLLHEQRVEEDCNGDCHESEQDCMPRLRNVVALVEDYEALNLRGYCERLSGHTGLPAEDTKPT